MGSNTTDVGNDKMTDNNIVRNKNKNIEAAKDLVPGDVVLEASPLVSGSLMECSQQLLKISENSESLKKIEINIDGFIKDSKAQDAEKDVIKIIKDEMKLEKDEDKIRKIIRFVEKYSLPLENGKCGVYEIVPDLVHSCSPNTYYSVSTESQDKNKMIFRASKNIRKGEIINFCKTSLMKCNYVRRKLLEEKGINCSCQRCSDVTEFGTNFGSGFGTERFNKFQTEMDQKSVNADNTKDTILNFENLLNRPGEWESVPENSQLLSDIKYRLMCIYQYHQNFYHPDEDYLKKKIQYCSEWIELSEKLFPGRNYERLLVQYERMNATVSLMLWMKQNCKPNDEVNILINEIIQMSQQPIEMLVDEEDGSFDGSFLKAFRDLVQISIEARAEDKKRVIINRWQDDDEEEW